MLNLLLHTFSMPRLLDRLWRALKTTEIGPFIAHRSQVVPAAYALQGHHGYAREFAKMYFCEPLRGAGGAWESRMPLPMEPGATCPLVTTGANVINFNVLDFCEVLSIRFAWQVQGTVTALVLDFDKYPAPTAVGTVVDKLDTTNGVLTAPSIAASQAPGAVVYKDLGDRFKIDLDPAMSVQAIVTTTTTAGSGVPAVIVVPRSETMLNLASALAFVSA
jgi:hypothetical protein